VVLMDGEPVKSCTVLAATAERYEITTVEGLERDGVLDPVQQGFHEEHGLQCGFCTPGMVMAATGLLAERYDQIDDLTRAGAKIRYRADELGYIRAEVPVGKAEAVAELLQEESLIAADVNGDQVTSGFARVEAFRRGFMEGSAPCTEDFA